MYDKQNEGTGATQEKEKIVITPGNDGATPGMN